MKKTNIQKITEEVENAPCAHRSILPQDCPVKPLGYSGDTFLYLDTSGQLVALPANKHTKQSIEALFKGHGNWLDKHFGRYGKPDERGRTEIIGIHLDKIMRALMAACEQQGFLDPATTIRGRGCWENNGQLVYHAGNKLFLSGGSKHE